MTRNLTDFFFFNFQFKKIVLRTPFKKTTVSHELQSTYDAVWTLLQRFQAGAIVVVIDRHPLDFFFLQIVLQLLRGKKKGRFRKGCVLLVIARTSSGTRISISHLQILMNVKLLKLFVGEVDAQLLQAIHVQDFEAVNVE